MELFHVKMKHTGEDIIGMGEKIKDAVVLTNPITVVIDPHAGVFCKKTLLLSDKNRFSVPASDMTFCHRANDSAKQYYERFTSTVDSDSDDDSTYQDVIESRNSTIH